MGVQAGSEVRVYMYCMGRWMRGDGFSGWGEGAVVGGLVRERTRLKFEPRGRGWRVGNGWYRRIFPVEDVKARRDAIARGSEEVVGGPFDGGPSRVAVVPVSRKGTEVYQSRDEVTSSFRIASHRIVLHRIA